MARRVIAVFMMYLFKILLHEMEAELRDVTCARRLVSENVFAH